MGKIQSFLMRQVAKHKLKGMPPAQREAILAMMEKNPEFFKKIGEEVKKRKKSGQSEMEATMQVMREHQADFIKMMQ